MAVEKFNKEKLLSKCENSDNDGTHIRTKSKHIHLHLSTPDYERQPPQPIIQGSKQRAKTIILARHGMLECGSNYRGTIPSTCHSCSTADDENHRLNFCTLYSEFNLANEVTKVDFNDVFSDDHLVLTPILTHVQKVWECQYANGRAKRQ